MNPDYKPHCLALTPACQSACDDTPVSYGHRTDSPQRIILADDHPVVLGGARIALCSPADSMFSVVALAHNADELINHLECTPCDLVISDYSMPYGRFPDGMALMGYLKRHFAHVPLMVMTTLRNPSLLQALLNAGVKGLFDKRSPMEELKRAAQRVIGGRNYLCPTFANTLQAQTLVDSESGVAAVSLSDRELEVVRLFVQGLSGRQIAALLNRSEKTISRQKRTAMDKLGLGHDGGLVEFAHLHGLIV
jgi:two-component system capsular synthesis response regulator RcsB